MSCEIKLTIKDPSTLGPSKLNNQFLELFNDKMENSQMSTKYFEIIDALRLFVGTDGYVDKPEDLTEASTPEDIKNYNIQKELYDNYQRALKLYEKRNKSNAFDLETGEPRLFPDDLGGYYFINSRGERFYVKDSKISETNRIQLIRAISFEMILNDTPKTSQQYINDFLNEKHQNLVKAEEDLTSTIGNETERSKRKELGIERLSYKKQRLLIEEFTGDLHFMKSLVKGIDKETMAAKLVHDEDLIKDGLSDDTKDVSLGFDAYLLASDEVKDTSTIDPEIFRLLATVTDFRIDKTGNPVDVTEPIFGMKTAKSSNEVKNRVLDIVNNIMEERSSDNVNPTKDAFDMMYDAMVSHGKNYNDQLINRFLINMDELIKSKTDPKDLLAFKIKFFKSFNKGSNVYILTELSKAKSGKISIEAVDPSLIQNKQSAIAQELISQLLLNNTLEDPIVLRQIGDIKDKTNLSINDIESIFSKLGISISYNTSVLLNNLQKDLSSLGFRGTDNTLKDLIVGLISMSKHQFVYDRKGVETINGKESVGLKANVRQALKLLKDPGTTPKKARDIKLAMGSMVNNNSLAVLANIESLTRTDLTDSTFNIAGKSRYKYSNQNGINKMIKTWQSGDIRSLKAMKGKGLPYVDRLLAVGHEDRKDYEEIIAERIGKLRLVTNAQLRDTGASGNAVEHKEIGEGDLMMDQMFKLMNQNHELYERLGEMTDWDVKAYWESMDKVFAAYTYNADKGGSLALQGIDQSITDIKRDPKLIIRNMFAGEVKTVMEHSNLINMSFDKTLSHNERTDFINSKLTQDYHFKKKATYTEPYVGNVEGTYNVTAKYNPVTGYTSIKKVFQDPNGNLNANLDQTLETSGITKELVMIGTWNKFGFFNSLLQGNEKIFDLLWNDANTNVPVIIGGYLEALDKQIDGESINDIVTKGVDDLVNENYNYIKEMRGANMSNVETSILNSNTESGIKNFIYVSLINNMQMFQMFAGDIGFYKQRGDLLTMEDALKRGPSPTTDGLQFMINDQIVDTDGSLNKNTERTYTTPSGSVVKYNAAKKAIIAIADNLEFENSHYDGQIKMGVTKALKRLGLEKSLNNYGHEIADAGAYMTLNHYMNVRNMIYGLTAKDWEHFNNLRNPDHKITDEDYNWLHLAGNTLQPAKLVGQEKRGIEIGENENAYISYQQPVFLKYAPMVLVPGIVEGTEAEALLIAMEKQGVDQVVFKSGSKASNPATTTIHQEIDGKFDKLDSDLVLNPFEFSYSNLKWQVELPAHFDSENTIGNQHVKNLIANLDLKSDAKTYHYNGKLITAKELYDNYTSTIVNILKEQSKRFLDKHGIVFNADNKIDFNNGKIREMMISQLDINEDYALINILKNEDIPLETLPGVAQRLFPILSGFVHKKVGKIRTNTGSVIQVANIGFDRLTQKAKTDVLFLTNDTKLKPPIPVTVLDLKENEFKHLQNLPKEMFDDLKEYRSLMMKATLVEDDNFRINKLQDKFKDTTVYYFSVIKEGKEHLLASTNPTLEVEGVTYEGVMKINSGKVMMPFISIQKKLNMNWDQFKLAFEQSKKAWESGKHGEAIIDEKLFHNIISYRIPNQSISSNDKLEITGVLPPYVGDQVVVYHEITKKDGSDFDFDKLYLMMPSITIKTRKTIIEHIFKNHVISGEVKLNNYSIAVDRLMFQLTELKPDHEISKGRLEAALSNHGNQSKVLKNKFDSELEEMINDVFQNRNPVITNSLLETYLGDEDLNGLRAVYSVSGIKGEQNKLIELMGSILSSESTYDDLMSPLDSTLVRDSMYEILYEYYLKDIDDEERGNNPKYNFYKSQKYLTYKRNDLINYISTLKSESLEYTELVLILNDINSSISIQRFDEYVKKMDSCITLPSLKDIITYQVDTYRRRKLKSFMNNHLSDVAMSQIQGLELNLNIGIGELKLSTVFLEPLLDSQFFTKKEKYGIKITQVISSFIKASDEFFFRYSNINFYTVDVAMFLLRLGKTPREIFRLILHPVVKEITKESQSKLGIISKDEKQTINIKLGIPVDKSNLDKYTEKFNQTLKDYNLYNLSINELLITLDKQNNCNELVLGLWNGLVEIVQEIKLDMLVSKPDTYGAGKNIYEFSSRIINLNKSLTSNNLKYSNCNNNLLGKLYINGLLINSQVSTKFIHPDNDIEIDKFTFLGMIQNNSLYLVNSLAEKMFIEATPGYRAMLDFQMKLLDNPKGRLATMIKELSTTLYPLVLGQSRLQIHNLPTSDIDTILKDSVRALQLLKSDPKYRDLDVIKNFNINPLNGNIEFAPGKTFMNSDLAKIKEEFARLYLDNDTMGDILDLIKYAFLTTGFKQKLGSFNHILPKMYFTENGFDASVRGILNMLNDKRNTEEWNNIAEKALVLKFLNNPCDYRFVKFSYDREEKKAPYFLNIKHKKNGKLATLLCKLSSVDPEGNGIYEELNYFDNNGKFLIDLSLIKEEGYFKKSRFK